MTTIPQSFFQNLPAGLAQTGFLLEHEVAEAFGKAGWGVISNRFYIDDVDGKARELDLLVYRISTGKEIEVVTTLFISCKKDKENAWVFMSREKPKIDPNIDWQPVHYWTMQEPLSLFMKSSSEWKNNYVRADKKLSDAIFEIKTLTFATQLFSKNNVSPQNDRPIFDSIAGLMKAQDHEIGTLPSRMKKNRIYVFNLLTVVDAPIVEAHCKGSNITTNEINEIKHIARYIVNKRELTSRIHFINKASLNDAVDVYTKLAAFDKEYFNKLVATAYDGVRTNEVVRGYFAAQMTNRLTYSFNLALTKRKQRPFEGAIELNYDETKKELLILLPITPASIRELEKEATLSGHIKKFLKDTMRYEGKYRLDTDIPF